MRQDVIIIGAPRSGTNMLRDVLAGLPDCGTWPCDEINYIWRHGNLDFTSDEFRPEMATATIRDYIRGQFDRMNRKLDVGNLIEKTCANSLRVEFVRKVVPEAKFIVIRRDGVDAVASAMKRWTASLDVPYLLRKARFIPPSDLFYYASRYFMNRLHRMISNEGRLAYWGPRLDDMEDLLAHFSLPKICAVQWKRCVDATDGALKAMDEGTVYQLAYEAFVANPSFELARIANFLALQANETEMSRAVRPVTDKSVGAGRRALPDEVVAEIIAAAGDTLERHGYVR